MADDPITAEDGSRLGRALDLTRESWEQTAYHLRIAGQEAAAAWVNEQLARDQGQRVVLVIPPEYQSTFTDLYGMCG